MLDENGEVDCIIRYEAAAVGEDEDCEAFSGGRGGGDEFERVLEG